MRAINLFSLILDASHDEARAFKQLKYVFFKTDFIFGKKIHSVCNRKYLNIYKNHSFRKREREREREKERGRESCLLYTSDAADDMQCVDLGGRRIIKKRRRAGPYHTSTT